MFSPPSRVRLAFDWALYRVLLCLIAPWIPLRLLWRGRREPGYRRHWRERLGSLPANCPHNALWLHAVSLGETRAAAPLIDALRAQFPDAPLVVSCMTATGRETAQSLYGEFAHIVFLPYDYRWLMRRFLRRMQPCLGVLMETELWPNLIHAAYELNIPLTLANARLSERSARGYARLPALVQSCLQKLAVVVAQTEADTDRLRQLGARETRVCGNLKFDISPPPELLARGQAWRVQWGYRPVFLAASTRDGEEDLLLGQLAALPADALLVIVPRHPQRFEEVINLIGSHGLSHARRSELGDAPLPVHCKVLVGDSLGELFAYYAAADLAFIGGSLFPLGGQNLIEAASVGCPVLVGPHTFNFADATHDAIAAGAALRGENAEAIARLANALLQDAPRRHAMGDAGRQFAMQHRGAAACIAAVLAGVLTVKAARRPEK